MFKKLEKTLLPSFEEINSALYMALKETVPDQLKQVLKDADPDISGEFLCFCDIYAALSEIIPLHYTIVDLGCAYAPQSYYFRRHKTYIGVDLDWSKGNISRPNARFLFPNAHHYLMPIIEFIETYGKEFDLDTTFAICNYVPSWYGDNRKAVREFFTNVYTFYPAQGKEGR
jgi:hypothetical protein